MAQALFLAHGSPMIAIEDNEYTRFLSTLGNQRKPQSIVVFTSHWESDILTISSSDEKYETIYDFSSFPDELYTLRYPAKGSSRMAARLAELFYRRGIKVKTDTKRGLDHGAWTLLSRMYPKADIPVVQVSVNPRLSAQEQFQIGQAIREIGMEEALIIGSGVTVHNLAMIKWGQKKTDAWAVEFDDWLIDKVEEKDIDSLFKYESLAPHFRLAVPTTEHIAPLFICLGSMDSQGNAKTLYRSYEGGALSYLCFKFG